MSRHNFYAKKSASRDRQTQRKQRVARKPSTVKVQNTSGAHAFSMVKKGYIPWNHSQPQAILLHDVRLGNLQPEKSAEEAWEEVYSKIVEFKHVPFQQFKEKLFDYREKLKEDDAVVAVAYAAYMHDRRYYQRTHKSNGRPIFRLSPAQPLLVDDIKNKRHVGMLPSEFHRTRPEYLEFELDEFRPRIYQEQRLIKMENWMNHKRLGKEAEKQKKWDEQHKAREATLEREKKIAAEAVKQAMTQLSRSQT